MSLKTFYTKLFSIILISCLGTIVYSNAFFCSFHFDDFRFIVHNPFIQNIHNLQNIWHYWHSRFVTLLSVAINYHFNGLNVFGYHLFNLAVHLVTAILVWWLTLLTLSSPAMKDPPAGEAGDKITRHADLIALFVGLVFVAHPIQTGAVTYIWQRAASMAALFYLASLCFYVKSRLLVFIVLKPDNHSSSQDSGPSWNRGGFYYIGSLITAVLAMFTKENTVTLPLMILLYEFSFLKTKGGLNWKYLTPFLITIFIIPVTFIFSKSEIFSDHHGDLGGVVITPMHYFLTQFRVLVTYTRLVFLPLNQNFDYDYPVFKNIFELPVLISLLFLITIFYWAKRLFSKYRLVSFSIFWFFLTLIIPESSFWTMGDVILEYRLYLPLVGYSLFLVSGVYYLFGKNNIKTMVKILILIISCYSILTYQRNKVWKEEFTLWDDAAQKSPRKARPFCNRGTCYSYQGKFIQAMSDYNKALEIDPNYADVYYNRGTLYYLQGNLTQAMSDFNKVIKMHPDWADPYYNRGIIYYQQGDINRAISDFDNSIKINPDNADVFNKRGLAYYHQGNLTQAISDYSKAIEINPHNADVYINRGNVYGQQSNFTQALSDYDKALEINPKFAAGFYNRGIFYDDQGDFTQALSDYNKAIKLDPGFAGAYYNRAYTYYRLKEYDRAREDAHKAGDLGYAVNPGFLNALKAASGQAK